MRQASHSGHQRWCPAPLCHPGIYGHSRYLPDLCGAAQVPASVEAVHRSARFQASQAADSALRTCANS